MRMIRLLLPHGLIVLSGIFIVLLILDWYNPTMNFINNTVTLKLLWVFSFMAILNSGVTIASDRKTWREQNK